MNTYSETTWRIISQERFNQGGASEEEIRKRIVARIEKECPDQVKERDLRNFNEL